LGPYSWHLLPTPRLPTGQPQGSHTLASGLTSPHPTSSPCGGHPEGGGGLQEGGHPASLGPPASGCQNLLPFLFVLAGAPATTSPHPQPAPFLGGFKGPFPPPSSVRLLPHTHASLGWQPWGPLIVRTCCLQHGLDGWLRDGSERKREKKRG
jgi:hypothetical protein